MNFLQLSNEICGEIETILSRYWSNPLPLCDLRESRGPRQDGNRYPSHRVQRRRRAPGQFGNPGDRWRFLQDSGSRRLGPGTER